jgi:sugar lactone lactonase YvrE
MQSTWNKFLSPVKRGAGTCITVFSVSLLGLIAASAKMAAQQPIVVTGAATQLGALTGGWDGSQSPMGGTFAVGMNGDVYVGNGYSTDVFQITPGGARTVLVGTDDGSTATLDKYGNLYIAAYYDANVYKIPYNATAGTYTGWSSTAPTATCQGGNSDTTACIFAPAVSTLMSSLAGTGNAGYADIAFDAQGDLFFATGTLPKTTPNSIYECNLACISSSSATPTLIYSDTLNIGAMALDPWGNIFFIDGGNNGASSGKVSYLKEIPYTSGAYPSSPSPTVLETYTTSAGYNGLSGLTISGTGTIYFATNSDGIFAMPNTQSGGPNPAGVTMVSQVGGKAIALDAKGNLYVMNYNGGDVVSYIPVNHLSLGAEADGSTSAAVTGTIIDSSAACPSTLSASVTEFGVTTNEFAATVGASGSTAFGGSNGVFSTGPLSAAAFCSYSLSITFTPAAAGERNAALTISDSTNHVSGVSQLSGVGQFEWPLLDPGAAAAYTAQLSSPSAVIADAAGDVFVADTGSKAVYEFTASNPSSPILIIGSSSSPAITSPAALAFDANGNLLIGDNVSGSPVVYEIANSGTTGAFTGAGTAQTLINSGTLFGGTALASVNALAFGPNGTLYIADAGNARVVTYNPANGTTAVTSATSASGLQTPAGIAVDSAGNLYVADSGAKNVFVFYAAGGISTLASPQSPIPGVTEPAGVAVDASGSVLVADGQSGSIVWIPNQSGSLSAANAVPIESTPLPQASSLWMDPRGDLYLASAYGKEAYAINRSSAYVNFGTVVDGNSSSATVFFENAGNEATTLSASAITVPANSLFSIAAGAANPCGNSLSVPAGAYCEMTAGFAPITGTAAGSLATSGAINYSPSNSETINLAGTAATSSLPTPTIAFTPPSPVLVGQQVNLSSYASDSGSVVSTSPITFAISPSSPCAACASLSGTNNSVLTALSAGTVTIVANQAGNSSYAAAAPVTESIVIQSATASGVPSFTLTQATQIGVLGGSFGGGWDGSQSPLGGTFAVGPNGTVILGGGYGSNVTQISAGGAQTVLANGFNSATATLDTYGNAYIAADGYNGNIYKLPFNSTSGTYAGFTVNTTNYTGYPSANCIGGTQDAAACIYAPNLGSFIFGSGAPGFAAIAFDPSGNLIVATDAQSTVNKIYLCNADCEIGGTNNPTLLYTDTLNIGALAVDPWGNIFFVDGSNGSGGVTNIKELPLQSGSYAATPTLILSYTNKASYTNGISGLAIASNGTIYFATNGDGIYAIPNTSAGGPELAQTYAVSPVAGKAIALDSNGNLYQIAYSGGDVVDRISVNNASLPVTPIDGSSSANATLIEDVVNCSSNPTPTVEATENGVATTVFSGSITPSTSSCSQPLGTSNGTFAPALSITGSVLSATLNFNPTQAGPQSATLTFEDDVNGGLGTATVTGTGQETPQTITFTAPTTTTYTYSSGLQITFNATGGGSNNPIAFSIDSSSTGAGSISGNTLTVTQAGTIVIDANQTGGLVNGVYYEAAPQAQLTLTIGKAPQTISFAPPSSPVTYAPGLTVTLNATGGGSGNAIVFSVDSSSTGNGSISGNTLTVTQAGTITIDANQTGNVDYLAATQAQQTLVVNQAPQTITFVPITQPFHFIAGGGATLTVQATGGASDQPIVFTVDASSTMKGSFSASTVSGATSTATLTLPAQTATSGTIVIDATQPGNANYSAAAQAQETINVLAPLPTQTITFNNPGTQVVGTPLTLTATASSGFPVSYTATPSSVCTVAQSGATWSATFAASGNCSITASQPGDNLYYAAAPSVTQTFIVNPKGQVPAMVLDFSSSTINVQPGTNGLTQLTINSTNNFTGQVSFACSGLPSGYTCTFNPNPITVAAGGSATTTLTVTGSSTAALHRERRPFYPTAAFAVALCLLGFRRRNRLYMFLLVAIGIAGLGLLGGCGGSSSSTSASQAKSTSVTVTATSGSVQQTTTLTLLVQ